MPIIWVQQFSVYYWSEYEYTIHTLRLLWGCIETNVDGGQLYTLLTTDIVPAVDYDRIEQEYDSFELSALDLTVVT